MKNIEHVGIIGAGALGLLYANKILKNPGCSCSFITDSSRFDRLEKTTFIINKQTVKIPVLHKDNIEDKMDLIIIAVKNHHLDDILDLLKPAVSRDTILISVLNGIDSEDFLKKNFPQAKIIYTVALGMDAVKEGDVINFSNEGRLVLGTEDNDKEAPALLTLTGFLADCDLAFEVPDDIHRALWRKWMINVGVNQVSAVTGATYGVFQKDRDLRLLMDSAMAETIAVAKAAGVDLRDNDIPEWYNILNNLGPGNKTSMLQDIEARRKTEVESFSGRLMQLGAEYGVDVPVNRTLFRIIKTKELLYGR